VAYLDIDNLYKERTILLFRECFALEKIHGTSAHVRWKDGEVGFFSGGAKHENFLALFDRGDLTEAFCALSYEHVVVYGEAYGGKMQGMRDTYGDELRFVVFDVKIGGSWLSVPDMDEVARGLGFEVVPWRRASTDLEALNAERDRPSEVAIRRGITEPRKREGVVLRPLIELTKNNGERVIAKHKAEEFRETTTARPLDAEELRVLTEAQEISQEWVTEMRLSHVLDKFGPAGIEQTGDVIKAMFADVERESAGEVVMSKAARKAIGARTAKMFKARPVASLA